MDNLNWNKDDIRDKIDSLEVTKNRILNEVSKKGLEEQVLTALAIEKIIVFQIKLKMLLKSLSLNKTVDDKLQFELEKENENILSLLDSNSIYSKKDSTHKDFYELILKTNDFYQFLEKNFFPTFNSNVNLIISQSSAIINERDDLIRIFKLFLNKVKQLNLINDKVIQDEAIQHQDVEHIFFYNYVKEFVITKKTDLFKFELFEKYFVDFILNKSDIIKKIIAELEPSLNKLEKLTHPTEENIVDFVYGTNHYFVYFVKLFESREFSKKIKTDNLLKARYLFKIKTTISWIYNLSEEISELDLRIKNRVLDDFNKFMLELRKKEFKNEQEGYIAVKVCNHFLQIFIRDLKKNPSNFDLILENYDDSSLKFIESFLITLRPSLKDIKDLEHPSKEIIPIVEEYYEEAKNEGFKILNFTFEEKPITEKRDSLIPNLDLDKIMEEESRKSGGFSIAKLFGKGLIWGKQEINSGKGESEEDSKNGSQKKFKDLNSQLVEEYMEERESFVKKSIEQNHFKDESFRFLISKFNSEIVNFVDKIIKSEEEDRGLVLKKFMLASIIIDEFILNVNEEVISYINEAFKDGESPITEYMNSYLDFLLDEFKYETFNLNVNEVKLKVRVLNLDYFSQVVSNASKKFDLVFEEISKLTTEELILFRELMENEKVSVIINQVDKEKFSGIELNELYNYKEKFKAEIFKSFVDLLIKKFDEVNSKLVSDTYFNFYKYKYLYNKILSLNLESSNKEKSEVKQADVQTESTQEEVLNQTNNVGNIKPSTGDDSVVSAIKNAPDSQYFDRTEVKDINDFMALGRTVMLKHINAKYVPNFLKQRYDPIDKSSKEYDEVLTQISKIRFEDTSFDEFLEELSKMIYNNLDNIKLDELKRFKEILEESKDFVLDKKLNILSQFGGREDRKNKVLFRTYLLLTLKLFQNIKNQDNVVLRNFIEKNFMRCLEKASKSLR